MTDQADFELEPKPKPKKKKPPARKLTRRSSKGDVEGIGDNAREQLRGFAQRVMTLMEERDQVNGDIREVFAEAKSHGYNTKVMRKVIAALKRDEAEREEEQALFDMYMDAIRYAKAEANADG